MTLKLINFMIMLSVHALYRRAGFLPESRTGCLKATNQKAAVSLSLSLLHVALCTQRLIGWWRHFRKHFCSICYQRKEPAVATVYWHTCNASAFVFPPFLILTTSYCVKRCVFSCRLVWVREHSQNTCWCEFRMWCVCVFSSFKPQTVTKYNLHLLCRCVCEWLVSHIPL